MSYIKQDESGGGDTYTLKAAQSGADVDIQLDAATGTDSDVKLKAGTNITLTEASDTVTIDSAGAGGSIGVNQVAFGDPLNAGDIKGSNNFTFVDESGAVGADVKISGDRPTFTLEDDTGATDYKSIFRQSGASGYWVHADSTGVDKQMIRVAAADIIINELANDVDVRIEGDAVDNLFRTSATQNNVGVGGQPGANVQRLHVVGDSNNTSTTDAVVKIQNTVSGQTFTALELSNENDDANSDVTMRMRSNSGTDSDFEIVHDSFGGTTFLTNQPNTGTTAQMKIALGDVNINPNQADVDMIVEGSSDASLLRTDAALDKVGIGTTPAAFRSKLTVNAGTDRNALDLISSDASSDGGPNVRLYRDSGSPAPGDIIGTLSFIGKDDGGSDTEYARISGLVSDETGATEDGWLQFGAAFAGSIQPNMMTIRGDVPEIVVNEGSADVNFRVESNANANMFKVDAGQDNVGIGTAPDSGVEKLHVKGTGLTDMVVFEGTSEGSGANDGPDLILYNSATPTGANKFIGRLEYRGKNDAAASKPYGSIQTFIQDETAGTEDSLMLFKTMTGGSALEKLRINLGGTELNSTGSASLNFDVKTSSSTSQSFFKTYNSATVTDRYTEVLRGTLTVSATPRTITEDYCYGSNVYMTSSASVITLPEGLPGMHLQVVNGGLTGLTMNPAAGEEINGSSGAYTITDGFKITKVICVAAGEWVASD